MESLKVNDNGVLPSTVSVVALAISGSKKSKYVIRWAFENLIPDEGPKKICFKLLHVFPAITSVPTLMGGGIPISRVREDIAVAYRKEVEYHTQAKLLPYKMLCNRKKVHVEVVQVESDNVENAIADVIDKANINKLVVGASSTGGLFSSGQNLSARISECCPGFCTIYVVSKEKLASVRPSDPEAIRSTVHEPNKTSSFSNYSPNNTFNSQPDWTAQISTNSFPEFSPFSPPPELFQSTNQNIDRRSSLSDVITFHYIREGEVGSSNSDMHDERNKTSSFMSWTSLNNSSYISLGNQVNVNSELEHLRAELRHVRSMYAKAQTESIEASKKLKDLQEQRLEEKIKLDEIRITEEESREMAEQEKARYEATMRVAAYAKECAEKEAALRETTELAMLALRCTEFRQRDRPDLKSEILPILERLRIVSDKARDSASSGSSLGPFNHFICPIRKDVMNEPCVAADGYTYDRKAMEEWLKEHDTSPVTNLPLMNKNLIPNYTILAAIIEWRSGKC